MTDTERKLANLEIILETIKMANEGFYAVKNIRACAAEENMNTKKAIAKLVEDGLKLLD